jgi:hypothetical protein
MSPAHPSSPRYRGGKLDPVPRRDNEHLPGETSPESGPRRDARPPADQRAGATPDSADGWQPAVNRPEWQEPLARGEVDRSGLGIIDERIQRFSPQERRIAVYLAWTDGIAVVAQSAHHGTHGRKPDATVDEVPTEFKSLRPGASDATVRGALTSAKGQARHAVIDARDCGLTEPAAQHGIRRFLGAPYSHKVDAIRIIGDDYDIKWKRD